MTSAFDDEKGHGDLRTIYRLTKEVAHRSRAIEELKARQYSGEGKRRRDATIANLQGEIAKFAGELSARLVEKFKITLDARQ